MSCIPAASPTPPPSLQQQTQRLHTQVQQAQARQAQAEVEVERHLPAVEQAVATIRRRFITHARAAARAAVRRERRRAWGPALLLRPLLPDWRWRAALLGLLLLVLPWTSAHWLGETRGFLDWWRQVGPHGDGSLLLQSLLPSLLAYGLLVAAGAQLLAWHHSHAERRALHAFARMPLALVQVADAAQGDAASMYTVTRAPWPQRALHGRWSIPAMHGDLSGARLLALHDGAAEPRLLALIVLPGTDHAAACIVLDHAVTETAPQALHAMALALAQDAVEDAAPIAALHDHVQAWETARAQQRALQQRLQSLDAVQRHWADIALPDATLDQILKLVDLFVSGRAPAPKGMLLHGPPGTGKTLIARKLARHAGCHFEALGVADLKAAHIGHTGPKVQAIWQRCRERAPAILFIDECESVFARRGGADSDSFGAELVQTFLAEWDGFHAAHGQVLVIGATNRPALLDDAILSRFTASIAIGLPDAAARARILGAELRRAGFALEPDTQVIADSSGLSGRDLHTLVARVAAECVDGTLDNATLLAQLRALRGKGSTAVATLGWDDIVLPAATVEEFVGLGKELRNAETLATLGVPVPRGILMVGPPGTGKTQVARILASQSGLAFIALSSADLKAGYLGQSGQRVQAAFERARAQAPCIVFVDELDIVAPARGADGDDAFTREIVGQLLQELDGVASHTGQVFLLAASNHAAAIDPALLSRLDRQIAIVLPDHAARTAIVARLLHGKPLDLDADAAAAWIADRSEGHSGRDLQNWISRAMRRAVRRALQDSDDASGTRLQWDDLVETAGASV
ncbi:AAA family ATPase [Xanthomonas rydalmerensis]|uniref:AAA family ATPase n=1 Tax=Xanthomonas rydalmerensis TaxID=3046274 RepID=A0ABZ0JM41_9XANT|nr:AAA family ATPase [Xanthomonas sp. DM-2023]WOS40847.1 AAA family ATPase [Xanthomonas sp. DM-2023]WOS45032.1 AAA family ATPase [Xanthomonas sp. DM-2023]WOS49211.1 AAA family ATPase [Xanthomonas sp. DM-2023]WOS53391.1 AAA family ATPase [Xanthomonas sp. DM-2023]WOS57574.1 AAA family ATPase [Xanthomonas sp. DM-2023]